MVHFGGSEVTRPFFEVTEEKIPKQRTETITRDTWGVLWPSQNWKTDQNGFSWKPRHRRENGDSSEMNGATQPKKTIFILKTGLFKKKEMKSRCRVD